MNQHHVIFIDFSTVPEQCRSYQDYISSVSTGIKDDLAEAYPELSIDQMQSLWDILTNIFQKTGDRFLFVMDEWDALFHMPFVQKKEKDAYLLFLKMMLKDRVAFQLDASTLTPCLLLTTKPCPDRCSGLPPPKLSRMMVLAQIE